MVSHFIDGFSVVFSRGMYPLLTADHVAAASDPRLIATLTQMYKDAGRQVAVVDSRCVAAIVSAHSWFGVCERRVHGGRDDGSV